MRVNIQVDVDIEPALARIATLTAALTELDRRLAQDPSTRTS
jgi:hypothetical protein